jgi:spermidine synthase
VLVRADHRTVRLISGEREQSVWRKDQPDYLVHSYAQLVALAALTWPGFVPKQPGRTLIAGLGGGVLCRWVMRHLAGMQVDVVEPDRNVIEIAREYFELDKRVCVFERDGRSHFEKHNARYDIIILDAFDNTYIPADMLSIEFLRLVQKRLQPGGVLIANGWVSADFNLHEDATYVAGFGSVWELRRSPNIDGNRILICNDDLKHMEDLRPLLRERAGMLDERLGHPTQNPIPGARRMLSYLEMTNRLRPTKITESPAAIILTDGNADRMRKRASFDYATD